MDFIDLTVLLASFLFFIVHFLSSLRYYLSIEFHNINIKIVITIILVLVAPLLSLHFIFIALIYTTYVVHSPFIA